MAVSASTNMGSSRSGASNSVVSAKTSADIIHYAQHAKRAVTGLACQGCALSSLCLNSVNACDNSSADFLQAVKQGKPLRKGKHIYSQGAAFKSLYVVRSGALKAYNVSSSGVEQVVGFYLPGDIVGFDGMADGHHINSLVAMDTVSLCELPLNQLDPLLASNQESRQQILSLQSQSLIQQQRFVLQHCQNTAEERVAAFLLDMSQRFERRHLASDKFRLPMSRKDIASYLGLAVETISRLFSRFQSSGFIEVEGREITLLDFSSFDAMGHSNEETLRLIG